MIAYLGDDMFASSIAHFQPVIFQSLSYTTQTRERLVGRMHILLMVLDDLRINIRLSDIFSG
jgi:hypothetical protein